MPNMDGITATKTIRTQMKLKVPIIVLSAEIKDTLSLALEAGANYALMKPLDRTELSHAMTSLQNFQLNV